MLVLSRKEKEQIIIGDNITVRVVRIKSGSVLVGIDAPKDVSVHRGEVYNAIQEEKKRVEERKKKEKEG